MRAALWIAIALTLAPELPAAKPFRLGGPRVLKLDWSTRGLAGGDIDGDGRLDLAVINNDKAQIDLLFQRTPEEIKAIAPKKLPSPRWQPILEDAPFWRESVLTGDFMYDLELIDMNGDGRLDLVYTGKRDRLGARIQDESGEFETEWYYDKEEPNTNVGSIHSADLDGDGLYDLLLLTNTSVLVFRVEEGAEVFPTPVVYRVGEDNPQQLRARDLNQDGRLDLVYVAEGSDRAIRVRLQHEDGGFGPEFALPIAVGAADWDLLDGDPPHLLTIKRTRSELGFTELVDVTRIAARGQSLDVRSHPVPKSGVNASLFCTGDFDLDGRRDVVVADPDGSSIYLYSQDETGEYKSPREFPAPQGITSLAPLPRPGAADALLLCSEKEGMVGVSEMQGGRFSFPKSIPVPGEPMVALARDLDRDGVVEVVVATKDGRRFSLEILHHRGGRFEEAKAVKLGSIKRSPTGIFCGDLDHDGLSDIALFIPREATRLLRQKAPLEFEEIGEDDSVRKSQFEGVLPDRFAVGDFTGDGRDEMLVAGKGFVRAYRVGEGGALEVVDQANGRSSLDELSGPLLVDLDGNGAEELIAYHAESGAFQVLVRDEAGLFRYAYSVETGPIALTEARVEDLGGAAGRRLLVFGKDRFFSVPVGREVTAGGGARRSYRTDLEDVRYALVELGDLNHDGRTDIVAVDMNTHVLDFLSGDPVSGFRSAMFFKVYDDNRFVSAGRRAPLQPREIVVEDLTGDGLDDVVLLCHDRLLLYPQLEGPGDLSGR